MGDVTASMSAFPSGEQNRRRKASYSNTGRRNAAMCLAVPVRIVELRPRSHALVDAGGVRKEVSVALVNDAGVGDYVILHVGFALSKLDPVEAERTLALFAEADAATHAAA
jgi:hydrogenase expression/formation protein HypC